MADDNVFILPVVRVEREESGSPFAVDVPEMGAAGFGTVDGGLASMDLEAFLSIRNWVSDACVAQGATFLGGGIGFGAADLQLEIEGFEYNITIKPIPRS